MYVGQTIAIPVLNRHITHSQGVCQANDGLRSEDCVMADAVRDRFPGAIKVNVGSVTTDFMLNGRYVVLDHQHDMNEAIGTFDRNIDRVITGKQTLKQAFAATRAEIPAKVHAVVVEL